jgi:hypothetical protein
MQHKSKIQNNSNSNIEILALQLPKSTTGKVQTKYKKSVWRHKIWTELATEVSTET